ECISDQGNANFRFVARDSATVKEEPVQLSHPHVNFVLRARIQKGILKESMKIGYLGRFRGEASQRILCRSQQPPAKVFIESFFVLDQIVQRGARFRKFPLTHMLSPWRFG